MYNNINKEAWYLILSSIIVSLTQGFMWVDFPIYLSEVGLNALQIGIALSINTFIAAIFMIPIGSLSDKYGRKPFIILARNFSLIGFLILIFYTNYFAVLFASVFLGISWANIGSSYPAIMAEKTTNANRSSTFAYSSFLNGTFSAVGMLIGSIPPYLQKIVNLSLINSYRILFGLGLFGVLLSIVPILKVTEFYRNKNTKLSIIPKTSRSIVTKLSVLGMIGLGAGVLVRLFPLWFYLKYSVNVNVLGPIFAISSFLTAFASLFTPYMASKMGEVKTIVYTELASVLMLLSIPFMPSYILSGTLYILRSLLMNMSSPIMTSFTMTLIPEEERALGSSLINFFDSLPRSFGPAIGGFFINIGLLNMPFYFTAALYSISILLFYLFFRGIKIKEIS